METNDQAGGGRFEIRDGKRVRVEEPTKDHPEGNRAREADGMPVGEPAAPARARAARVIVKGAG